MTEGKPKAKFIAPQIQDNPLGWGPCTIPEQYKDMPYQPFSKSDKIGKVADWTGATYQDRKMANKYNTAFGGGGQYAYYQDDDEGSYQLVDTGRGTSRVPKGSSRFRIGQRNIRNRNQTRNQMQVLGKGGRGGRTGQQQPRGTQKWQRPTNRKYDPKGQGMKKRDTAASVNVKPSWKIVEEMDFPRLAKLSLPNVPDGIDIYKAGSLEFYDKAYDRVTCKTEKPLQRINRISFPVTTTDDPIIRQLSKTQGQVFATDSIISHLMCSTRSVTSWDVVVSRIDIGGEKKLFFDKREESSFDLLTVNETAAEPPYVEEDSKNSINSPHNLAMEATYININFSQQVLIRDGQKYPFDKPNPFIQEDIEGEPVSVAYRYRKFNLGDGIELVVRTELDAVAHGPAGDVQFMNIKGLNEWDPKASGGINWRQKLDIQKGAVLANEMKNNSCKLAKWTVQSLLAGADQLRLGYVSRVHVKDSTKHAILGTQHFKPIEFANQMNLNLDNAWGILRCIIDTCMRLNPGKYLILKDPNKPALILYEIPSNFEEDDDDDDESLPDGNENDEGEGEP